MHRHRCFSGKNTRTPNIPPMGLQRRESLGQGPQPRLSAPAGRFSNVRPVVAMMAMVGCMARFRGVPLVGQQTAVAVLQARRRRAKPGTKVSSILTPSRAPCRDHGTHGRRGGCRCSPHSGTLPTFASTCPTPASGVVPRPWPYLNPTTSL